MLRYLAHCPKHFSTVSIVSPSITVPIFESLYEISKAGHSVKIPRIVMIGNQSSGKTSLLEAMCSINNLFEKRAGLATKRPMFIYLNKIGEGEGDFVKIGRMGEKITNMSKARIRISEENNIDGISDEPLDVAIYSPNITHSCNLIDLPGFISTVRQGQDEGLPGKIKRINEKYIGDDGNLKLIVMSATEDVALSLGLMEIKKAQQLHNSLGVFTKIDLITNDHVGTAHLEELLTDKSYTSFKCVGVKLRSTADITAGMTIPEMIKSEDGFISKYFNGRTDLKLGLNVLMKDISDEQIRRISHELPEIRHQLATMIENKRHGNTILDRLAQANDMSDISKELDRIITEIHPESDLRIELERKINNKIKEYVKSFISQNKHNIVGGMGTIRFNTGTDSAIPLNFVRTLRESTNSITSDPDLFSRNMMYGLCKADVQNEELARLRIDNFHELLSSPFIRLEKVSSHNKVTFIRSVQKIIDEMIVSKFSENVVNIVLNEIKDHILQKGDKSDDLDDIGRIFFVHIFEKICERANQDDLKRAITRMIIRERRLNIDYSKLTEKLYLLLKDRMGDISSRSSVFSHDKFPISVELYGGYMFTAYTQCLIDEISKDCYRLTSENLLDPIITNAIKYSLDTVSKKDFTGEQEVIKTQIDKLLKQLEILDAVISKTHEQDHEQDHEQEQIQERPHRTNGRTNKNNKNDTRKENLTLNKLH
jgi:hypothetical protein